LSKIAQKDKMKKRFAGYINQISDKEKLEWQAKRKMTLIMSRQLDADDMKIRCILFLGFS